MARPLRIQYPGAFYHVTCRGNKRSKVFIDNDDRYWFFKFLKESLEIYQVALYAYVLMDNHFHLVLQTTKPNLNEFMRRFNICYTGWFNYHHDTYGHLYQGRYKALVVDADNYLLELSRYVHLNPVRVTRFQKSKYYEPWRYIRAFKWSSLPGYINAKKVVDFINYDMILSMIGGRGAYRRFLLNGLKKGIPDPFDNVQHQTIIGDDDFVAFVKNKHIKQGSQREQPMYHSMLKSTIKPKVVMSCVADTSGIEITQIKARSGNGIIRGITAEMLYRYSSVTQRDIGQLLGGIEYTAVSMLRCRLKKKMKNNKLIRDLYRQIEYQLSKICEV